MKLASRYTSNQSGFWMHVRFGYNKEISDQLKQYPGVTWNPNAKVWMVPLDVWPIARREVFHDV